jgi:thiol-disulfide isomerase/thioredoxin
MLALVMTIDSSPAPGRKPAFGWVLVLGLLIAAAAAWAAFHWSHPTTKPHEGLAAGDAVAFARDTLDGRHVSLDDYRGRVVLVDFWATWCGPCHLQADILAPLYAEYRARGVEFLSVSVGEEANTVRDFVAHTPSPYPVLIDPEDKLSPQFGIVALPTVLIVDKNGKVAYFNFGISDAPTLRKALAEAGAA